jgi:hypothetical protein
MEPVKELAPSPAEPVSAAAAAPAASLDEPAQSVAAEVAPALAPVAPLATPASTDAPTTVTSNTPISTDPRAEALPEHLLDPKTEAAVQKTAFELAAQKPAAQPSIPPVQPPRLVTANPGAESAKLRAPRPLEKRPEAAAPTKSSRFGLLAASIALAACVGAAAGTAGTAGISRLMAAAPSSPAPAPAVVERIDNTGEIKALREAIAQVRVSIRTLTDGMTALRANADQSVKTNQTQLAKLGETLDRLERRATASASAPEVTGSVAKPTQTPVADPKAKPAVIEGWILRDVYEGVAFVTPGRSQEGVEVVVGDDIRGVGRVQEIRRIDGRWAVVTNRGIITSR